MIRRVGHGHGHGHGELDDDATPVGRTARVVLLVFLAIAAFATAVGVGTLWPDRSAVEALQDDVSLSAPGVTYPSGSVVAIKACPATGSPGGATCGLLSARLTDGGDVVT